MENSASIFDAKSIYSKNGKNKVKDLREYLNLIIPLCLPDKNSESYSKQKIYKNILSKNRIEFISNHELRAKLQREYESISYAVRRRNPGQFIRTEEELRFQNLFESNLGIKLHKSVLCGPFTLDFLCTNHNLDLKNVLDRPALYEIKSTRYKGVSHKAIVFEINGGCHESQQNIINKDSTRAGLLAELGLATIDIQNEHINQDRIFSLISNIKKLKENCSKSRKKIWYKIYLATIWYYSSENDLKNIFGFNRFDLDQIKKQETEINSYLENRELWS